MEKLNLTPEELGFNVDTYEAKPDAGGNKGAVASHHEIHIYNIGDAVNLKSRLVILSGGKDIAAKVKPSFAIVTASGNNTGNANGEIELDASDGYVVAKANTATNKFVTVTASIEASNTETTSDTTDTTTKTVYFDIYVQDSNVAQG